MTRKLWWVGLLAVFAWGCDGDGVDSDAGPPGRRARGRRRPRLHADVGDVQRHRRGLRRKRRRGLGPLRGRPGAASPGPAGAPRGTVCGVECVDTETDTLHCGACDASCNAGEVCVTGNCCVPSPEDCNGVDDDCDGIVDEGTGADVGCEPGIACVAGACECEAPFACGGMCVNVTDDPNNCGGCGNACGAGRTCRDGVCCTGLGASVDMLFLVDNSNSMTEEQANLTAALPNMVRGLATGDVDNDGVQDGNPVVDLHLGVITADMGTGGFTVPTCANSSFGDDGILRTTGRTDIPGCMATYPSFLDYTPGGGLAPDQVAADFACVATAGTGGCGFEQPLEAVLKAVTPSTSTTRFFMGSQGNADVENLGFLRAGSIFVPILLTDENDCSAADPELYNPSSAVYTADLNLRCFSHATAALHPTSRYVRGMLATRADARNLIFTAITGVPTDLVTPGVAPNFATILGDARMLETVDPAQPNRLLPSCNEPGTGLAFPPRRIVETAQGLGAMGSAPILGSICQNSYESTLRDLVTRITMRQNEICSAP